MQFQIYARRSSRVVYECELDASFQTKGRSEQLGAAVKKALAAGSDLSGCDLSGCDLSAIRDDLWAVLSAAPREVQGLRDALADGRVDGSTYEGVCACLVGTIANLRHTDYRKMEFVTPNSTRPIERFFMGIKEGDTPETNQVSKLALEWVDQWLVNMIAAFCPASLNQEKVNG